ncbi:SDR family oxidoreductase [Pseudomonas sp. PDM04]|jgi:3-oxoacyl-[acyl-carrier protein] reductase|uniref:SDR family oxidoreductase n=1 Tax=Pseudomonas sp. PDM04 TaxID=2769296 RepID=UPI00177DA894|nr:SDR family oxidoreductase [Pseudomonas sp. PDM04]MBD9439779.1 SDR family oxidoreductase [Pseudomonas sp. PDM04]
MNKRLQGHVALVTGGAGGIGSAICLRLAEEGARVVVADLGAGAQNLAQSLIAQGHEACAVSLDVSSRASWQAAVAELPPGFEALDIVVNVAGIVRDRSLIKMTDEEWQAVIDVNLRGSWLGCQFGLAAMNGRGWGRIINIASTAIFGTFGQSNYSSAKAGVVGLTHTVALEAARHGVLVNAVAPGIVETPILASVPEDVREKWISRMPLGRPAQPAEIASVVAFLASNDASYMTGQVLIVDGGATTGDY